MTSKAGEIYQLAYLIASKAHAGALDKQGQPYFDHPIRVALDLRFFHERSDRWWYAKTAAILHDVVEDTSVTMDDLIAQGIHKESIKALRLLTHSKGVRYSDYVIGCSKNDIAAAVKMSDLRDNLSPNRILLRFDHFNSDTKRIYKYVMSYKFLYGHISEEEYLEAAKKLNF